MSERCFVCGLDNPNVIERHHIVPRRYDGSDTEDNQVSLCANCHRAVEKIYSPDKIEEIVRAGSEAKNNIQEPHDSVEKYVDECLNEVNVGQVHLEDVHTSYKNWCQENKLLLVTSKYDFRSHLESVESVEIFRDDHFGWVCDQIEIVERYAPENPRDVSR